MAVYSLGNFVFPKAGIQGLSSFLGGAKPSKENVKTYIKSMKNMFSPTQMSYMFRITVNKLVFPISISDPHLFVVKQPCPSYR